MAEDFNKLRMISKQLVQTPFQRGWQFRVEIEGQPEDWDLFVKDISYCPFEVQTEEIHLGVQILTYPIAGAPIMVALTMRDHEDRRIYEWFKERVGKVLNSDGTVNLPFGKENAADGYVFEMKRFSLLSDNSEKETDVWQVFPTKLGDISQSVEDPEFLEFPIAFVQFRSRR